MSLRLSLTALLASLAMVALDPVLGCPAQVLPVARPDPVDFNRDIRPLLSDRCFKCHGFDAQQRRGGIRLDTLEGLTARKKDRAPVVPGDPGRSEMVRRVTSEDPEFRMPPRGSGVTLSVAEIEVIRRWVAEGAPFERHWAFVPPEPEPLPAVEHESWVKNPIDRFVLAQLERRGLGPSEAADRTTLIRRLSQDLIGLPPTPQEVDAFLEDRSPEAYDRLVDHLLASPHHGERMAIMWLDVARYADTNGFHHDNARMSWPYRDWVIRAFNENMPFDRFVVEQLAGDLLPSATVEQQVASGFCRMHNINDEGGALDPEYRVEAVADRIETISTAFMGLTFTCARCHDHKYDPFTQEDYYSLYAYFNSVEERGVYPANFEQARAYPARVLYRPPDLDARMGQVGKELEAARGELDSAGAAILEELAVWESDLRETLGISWVEATLEGARSSAGATLTPQADGSVLAGGATPAKDTYTLVLRTEATGLRLLRFEAIADERLPTGSVGRADNGNAVVTAVSVEAVSVNDPGRREPVAWAWAWADHEQPNGDFDILNLVQSTGEGWALEGHHQASMRTGLLIAKEPFGFEGGTRLEVTLAFESRYANHAVGRPRVTLAQASGDVLSAFPVVTRDWWQAKTHSGKDFDAVYAEAYGPENATAIDRNDRKLGWKHRPDVRDGTVVPLSGERSAFYFGRTLRSPVERTVDLSLGSDDAFRLYLNGKEVLGRKVLRGAKPDQDRLELTVPAGESLLVLKIVNNGGPGGLFFALSPQDRAPTPLTPAAFIPGDQRPPGLQQAFLDQLGSARSETYRRLSGRRDALAKKLKELEAEAVPILVMKELEAPTKTHVLARGRYDLADEKRPVTRRPPQALGGSLPDGAPDDRLGFARWLTDPKHPLTARVHVNRLWQMIFGTGIVRTTENFGHQSEWPSHPALLDWLAVRFMDSGWDQKALLKLIVTSATYRQSSRVRPEVRAIDAENRLLASFPRRRLAGELIRDQALYVAGLLVPRVGGPSVRPYQPDGLWREVSIGGSSNTQIFKADSGDALYRRSLYTFWKRTSPSPQMISFDAPTREFCVVRRDVTNTPLQALILWNDVQFLEAARALAQRTLEEVSGTSERLTLMFRKCTGRRPEPAELAALSRCFDRFLSRYRNAPEDGARLLRAGEAPLPGEYDPAELAAWMMLGNALLNLDATVVRS